jgi:hypothetical protein
MVLLEIAPESAADRIQANVGFHLPVASGWQTNARPRARRY